MAPAWPEFLSLLGRSASRQDSPGSQGKDMVVVPPDAVWIVLRGPVWISHVDDILLFGANGNLPRGRPLN